MGFTDNGQVIFAKKQLDATERTNALLAELLTEVRQSNELTKRLILHQRAAAPAGV